MNLEEADLGVIKTVRNINTVFSTGRLSAAEDDKDNGCNLSIGTATCCPNRDGTL